MAAKVRLQPDQIQLFSFTDRLGTVLQGFSNRKILCGFG
jgi:hypothetical protein